MKIEGQYEAQLKISFCEDTELSLEQIQDILDDLSDAICALLNDELMLSKESSTITVTKIYADVKEVEE